MRAGKHLSIETLACGVLFALASSIQVLAAAEQDSLLPSVEESRFRYATDYPVIGYSKIRPSDRIAALQEALEQGEKTIEFEAPTGYLRSLLAALDIELASQLLVFSKTSLNKPFISPHTPRAIYFNDDTYVARVPGAGIIEIASMDPQLGPLFYVLEERDMPAPRFDRQTVQCLRCHDSLTMTGGGVPRFILGTGYIDTRGDLVSHEGWILTDQRTPLKFRWGGWYVTGEHGAQPHLGNIIVKDPATLQHLDDLRIYNLDSLDGLIASEPYPTAKSDIVAHLVIEHQVHVQNLITRVNYDTRMAMAALPDDRSENASISEETKSLIAASAETLVQAMLFEGEAKLASPIRSSNAFAARFERRGPVDEQGRSLRQLDLETRLFRYPLSYLVYSAAFDGLPDAVKAQVFRRFGELLGGDGSEPVVARLDAGERAAILSILEDTKPEFASTATKASQRSDTIHAQR